MGSEEYDTVTSDWAELYDEYCRESDRLFFEWQYDMRHSGIPKPRYLGEGEWSDGS